MTQKKIINVAASVRQRLLNISKERGEEPNIILIHYALERLLYRLSKSDYATQFVLKGAMLFTVWAERPHRSTRDLDLLGFGDSSPNSLKKTFRSICEVNVQDDGLLFDDKKISVSAIRRTEEYHGQRVRFSARLGSAIIPVQVDIGIGDAFAPEIHDIEFPTILNFPPPRIRAYNRETVIAEKLNAMVVLGRQNSRMKDFYDIFVLAREFPFKGEALMKTICTTFERRHTAIPAELPLALTKEFGSDHAKEIQWKGFLRRSRLKDVTGSFSDVVSGVRKFLEAPIAAASSGKTFSKRWPANGPWS